MCQYSLFEKMQTDIDHSDVFVHTPTQCLDANNKLKDDLIQGKILSDAVSCMCPSGSKHPSGGKTTFG